MRGGPREDETCRRFVIPALSAAGWEDQQVVEQLVIQTERRLRSARGEWGHAGVRRNGRADYVLEALPGVPVAVVEAKRAYDSAADGIGQAVEYAAALDVPLAYATNGSQVILRDLAAGTERHVDGFLTPVEAWSRWRVSTGATDDAVLAISQPASRALLNADGSVKQLRHYQQVAVHRVLRAMLGGQQRILVLMATGTGKTFTALQLVAKLRSYWAETDPTRNHRVLYLADRDWLVQQPEGYFTQAFEREAVVRIRGASPTSRDVYLATYQALDRAGTSGEIDTLFREYPADFFDLLIVDECHRGSAGDDSSWRAILDHFAPAVQLGLTATPKRDANGDTYAYFGEPVFEYSLRQGIEDGYLAPYRVRRVVLDVDADGWRPDPGQLDDAGRELPDREYRLADFERLLVLPERTRTIARHLAAIFRADPGAKAMVFCVDSDHAARMRAELVNAAPDLAAADPEWVVRIVAREPRATEYLERFADPTRSSPTIATTSRMLSTGVDVEDLRYVVLARSVGSMVEFKQIVGRGTRLYPDKGKLSFEIIDYVGATRHFADPEFDGPPQAVRGTVVTQDGDEVDGGEGAPDPVEPESGAEGMPGQDRPAATDVDVAQPVPPYDAGSSDEPAGPDPERRRYVVSGVSVERVAEGFYVHDRTGSAPRLVSYLDYAAEQVRSLCPVPDDLRRVWSAAPTRREIADALAARGVDLVELERVAGLPGADAFDVLAHAAWRLAPETRAERARRVRDGARGRLAEMSAPAREVLGALLDRYAQHGVDDLSSPLSLELPPVDALGAPVELARRFGGPGGYRHAIEELQHWLYSA